MEESGCLIWKRSSNALIVYQCAEVELLYEDEVDEKLIEHPDHRQVPLPLPLGATATGVFLTHAPERQLLNCFGLPYPLVRDQYRLRIAL